MHFILQRLWVDRVLGQLTVCGLLFHPHSCGGLLGPGAPRYQAVACHLCVSLGLLPKREFPSFSLHLLLQIKTFYSSNIARVELLDIMYFEGFFYIEVKSDSFVISSHTQNWKHLHWRTWTFLVLSWTLVLFPMIHSNSGLYINSKWLIFKDYYISNDYYICNRHSEYILVPVMPKGVF